MSLIVGSTVRCCCHPSLDFNRKSAQLMRPCGDDWQCGEERRLSVPYANISKGLPSINITVQHIIHFAKVTWLFMSHHPQPPPWGYALWNGIGWLLDTQVQIVGLTSFCWERHIMGPPLMAPNITWGERTVLWLLTPWLGHQNVSFKAGFSLSPGGGLTFLITG